MKKLKRFFSLLIVLCLAFTGTLFFTACKDPKDPENPDEQQQQQQGYHYNYTFYLEKNGEVYHTIQANQESEFVLPQSPTLEGATFLGWQREDGYVFFTASGEFRNYGATADLYPKWQKTIHVTYELFGGENHVNNPAEFQNYTNDAIQLFEPTMVGQDAYFIGWYLSADFSGEQVWSIYPNDYDQDITLYAKWSRTVNVTYELDGGTNDSRNVNSYFSFNGSNLTLYPATKPGFKFLGWYKDSNFTNEVLVIDVNNASDLKLYAKWGAMFNVVNTTITGVDSESDITNLEIPYYYNGVYIDTIGANAFEGLTNLKSVTISEGVVFIQDNAFNNCPLLSSVKLPSTIGYISESSFAGCLALDGFIIENGKEKLNGFTYITYDGLKNIEISDTVKNIGQKAFYNFEALEQVVIGNNVEIIGDYAFYNCKNLKKVVISGSVKTIGEYAFAKCENLEEIVFEQAKENVYLSLGRYSFSNTNKLKSLTIPKHINAIGELAFSGIDSDGEYNGALGTLTFENDTYLYDIGYKAFANQNLKNLNLPANISVSGSAFADNENLETVRFEVSCVNSWSGLYIGERAFENCLKLSSIEFPDIYQTWDREILKGCYQLKELTIPAQMQPYYDENTTTYYCLQGLDPVRIRDLRNDKSFTLSFGGNVEHISEGDFVSYYLSDDKYEYLIFENKKILFNVIDKTITSADDIATDITSIRDNAFRGVNNLTSVIIPEGVVNINASLFEGLSKLTTVNLPSTLTSINERAFFGTAIEEITIPSSVVRIFASAFAHCLNLKTVVIQGAQEIGFSAFEMCKSLENVTLTTPLFVIGANAFTGCSSLKTINIPRTVNYIGYEAFLECENLETVTFGEQSSLTELNPGVFDSCYKLKNIVIPKSIEKIWSGAFYNCYSLESIVFEEDNPYSLAEIGEQAFGNCIRLREVKIPSNVKTLKSAAFANCISLVSVELPASLLTIQSGVFASCYNIAQIRNLTTFSTSAIAKLFDDSLFPEVKTGAFDQDDEQTFFESTLTIGEKYITLEKDEKVYLIGFKDKSATTANDIPSNVTHISMLAFYKTNLESITLPESLVEIETMAFAFTKLKTITIPENVTIVGSEAFYGSLLETCVLNNIDKMTSVGDIFENCEYIKNIVIPEGILSIDGTFKNSKIETVTIPSTVISIGNSTFSDCVNLKSVIFADQSKLETIGYSAFRNCKSLTSIIIPDSVLEISMYAFEGCSGLTSVTFGENLQIIGTESFKNCVGLSSINITKNVETIESSAFDNAGISSITFDQDFKLKNLNGFSGCKNLKELIIPEGIEVIEDYAFANCTNLTTITFPSTLTTTVNYTAFNEDHKIVQVRNLSSLELGTYNNNLGFERNDYLEYKTTNEAFTSSITYGDKYVIFDNCIDKIIIGITDLTQTHFNDIPGDVTMIGSYALTGVETGNVVMKNIKMIYKNAFYDVDVKSLIITGNANGIIDGRLIGHRIVSEQTLNRLFIGEGAIKTIGSEAFKNSLILDVYIPASVQDMGGSVFANCDKLEKVVFAENGKLLSIPTNTFMDSEKLVEVVIPNSSSIESIGASAFEGTALEKINLPKSLKTIYNRAFYNLSTLNHIEYDPEIEIETIGDYAFYNVNAYTFRSWFKNVISIGKYAFQNCNFDVALEISNKITSIGEGAFKDSYLSSYNNKVIFEEGADIEVGAYAFANIQLSEITLNSGEYYFGEGVFSQNNYDYNAPINITFKAGAEFNFAKKMFNYNKGVYTLNIEEGAVYTSIGDYAFYQTNLEGKFIVTNNIFSIGEYAFSETKISEIEFEQDSDLTTIGARAFFYCEQLTELDIPASVKYIGERAFGSLNLTRFNLAENGKNLVVIGEGAFADIKVLTTIDLSNAQTINEYAFGNCENLETVTFGTNNVLTAIEDGVFNGTAIRTIVLPSSVIKIGRNAFYGCQIANIDFLTENITEVADFAFVSEYVVSAVIPASVETISPNAFKLCNNLVQLTNFSAVDLSLSSENVNFEYSLTGQDFDNTISITDDYITLEVGTEVHLIKVFKNVENLVVASGVTHIDASAAKELNNLKTVSIADSVVSIGDNAFNGCRNLETVTISPDSQLTHIGESAFYACESLTSIYIPAGIQNLSAQAFYYCVKLENVTLAENTTLVEIGARAFAETAITTFTLPDSVKYICEEAFKFDFELETFIISQNTNLTNIESSAFLGVSVAEFYIPATLEALEVGSVPNAQNYIFASNLKFTVLDTSYGFGQATELVVPEGITEIKGTFHNLTKLVLSSTVTTLATNDEYNPLFYKENIEIIIKAGSKLENISSNICQDSYYTISISKLVIEGESVPSFVNQTNISYFTFAEGASIYVEDSLVETYKTLLGQSYETMIKPISEMQ